tara:strand:- start:211472 stop:212734 length:1263 start_codon:yes stop_codon:yes gene_type:complete
VNNTFDVVIVSIFGRGHWLAAELAEAGQQVALVDVSHRMGRWAPEDWEGPFGFFHSDRLSASQIERLSEDDYHDNVEQGFTLWLRRGPIDTKGPLSAFWFQKLGFSEEVSKYVTSYNLLSSEERKSLQGKIADSDFEKTWFAHLCHQLASSTYVENAQSITEGRPLNVMSPLNIRRTTRRGFEKSLQWCESKGVTVFRDADLIDGQVENGQLSRIEIRGDWSGNLSSEQFIWQLTSDESYHASNKLSQILFPQGRVKPVWSWVRYRIQLDETPTLSSLPNQFVLVKDLFLPWTHSNLMVVQKTVRQENFDVWVKIPSQMRYQRTYLENVNQEILDEFKLRIPKSKPVNVDMPQDYLYEESELGPSRFPVYLSNELKQLKRGSFKNVSFDGPENWVNLDWLGQFESQTELKHKMLVLDNHN